MRACVLRVCVRVIDCCVGLIFPLVTRMSSFRLLLLWITHCVTCCSVLLISSMDAGAYVVDLATFKQTFSRDLGLFPLTPMPSVSGRAPPTTSGTNPTRESRRLGRSRRK